MIEEAISYPFEGEDAVTALLIGSMLLFASTALFGIGFFMFFIFGILFLPVAFIGLLVLLFAFAVTLPVSGYFIDVLRTTAAGHDEPPVFDDWEKLFVDGVKAGVIGFLYGFVPSMLLVLVGVGLVGAGGAAGDTGGGILSGLGVLVVLLAIPVYLVVAYVTPAALTHFAVRDTFGAAFEFGVIFDIITDRDYVVAAVLALVVSGVAGSVAGMLYSIFIGFFVSPFILFYAYVASYRLFGKAYVEATDTTPTADRQQGV